LLKNYKFSPKFGEENSFGPAFKMYLELFRAKNLKKELQEEEINSQIFDINESLETALAKIQYALAKNPITLMSFTATS